MLDRLAPFGFVLLWSSSFIAARVGLRHLSPLLFVAVRMCVCALVLVAAMVVLRRPWRVLRGVWLHCAVAGVLMNAVLLCAAHVAMTRVPAAPIALIQTLNPLLTAALAWPVLGEKLRPVQWLGLLLGASGVVIIVGMAALHSRVELRLLLLNVLGVSHCAAARCISAGSAAACRCWRAQRCSLSPLPSAAWRRWRCSRRRMPTGRRARSPRSRGTRRSCRWAGWCCTSSCCGAARAARATANFYLMPGTAALMAWALLGETLAPLAVAGWRSPRWDAG